LQVFLARSKKSCSHGVKRFRFRLENLLVEEDVIKRLTMALAVTLGIVTLSFAEVQVKDLDGTNVEITFTFDDKSSEMGVIGSFDN